MNCKNPNLVIVDDGTLDKVVGCEKCDYVGRFNLDWTADFEDPNEEFVNEQIFCEAEEDHDEQNAQGFL